MSRKDDGFRHRDGDHPVAAKRKMRRFGEGFTPSNRAAPRTISDDLAQRELARVTRVPEVRRSMDIGTVRRESYEQMPSSGCYRRTPVRYG